VLDAWKWPGEALVVESVYADELRKPYKSDLAQELHRSCVVAADGSFRFEGPGQGMYRFRIRRGSEVLALTGQGGAAGGPLELSVSGAMAVEIAGRGRGRVAGRSGQRGAGQARRRFPRPAP